MFKRLDHVAICCSDTPRSVAFYQDNFGFEKISQHDRDDGTGVNAFLRLGDTLLEMTSRPGQTMSGFHICLEPVDFDAAVKALVANGLEPVVAPKPSTPRNEDEKKAGVSRAVFRGPDGELIEIRG